MVVSEMTASSTAVSRVLPYLFEGSIVRGFGRGGKQLGCPTANLDPDAVSKAPTDLVEGVYIGLASVDNGPVHPMVMSVGVNPQFQSVSNKTMEVHILHSFTSDFYGAKLRGVALEFLRPMRAFSSMQQLIDAIQTDISETKLRHQTRSDLQQLLARYFPGTPPSSSKL